MLIDTDVLVDVALDRRPYSVYSSEFLERVGQAPEIAWVAWHSISNLYYVVARDLGDEATRQFILYLTNFAEIAQTNTESIRYAAALEMRDFEDAMQVAAARACGARHIVTRNIRDFASSPIPAITPQEALTDLL